MSAPAGPTLAGLYGADQRRPLHSRLPALYFRTPPWVRSLGRWAVGARRGGPDALVQGYLARLEGWPAADGDPVPVLLTHDVDTAQGYAILPRLLAAEEALGLASLVLMVTHRYAWDPEHLAGLAERGHRFGVHDTTHDNTLAYLPFERVRARVAEAQRALGRLDCGAFRAPAFLRSRALYQGISGVISVDLSSNDWALLWPHPGDGIGSPFPVRHNRMVCVPTTVPRDGELLALRLSRGERLAIYKRKAEQLWRVGAPVIILTHPDPTFTDSDERIAAYAELLQWLAGSTRFRVPSPDGCLEDLSRRATVCLGDDVDGTSGAFAG